MRYIFIAVALFIGLSVFGYVVGWFHEVAEVTQEEFGPRAMLEKYEWFKDASAQLDKKMADVQIYEGRMKTMEKMYEGTARRDWPRADLEQYNLWSTEAAGVKASYNALAAEYNSQMAKFNWRFTNVGDLPEGATEPLPREYKPYVTIQ